MKNRFKVMLVSNDNNSNQRNFFRVDMRLETQYRILQYGTRKFKLLSKVENQANVVNLSAGGAALEINCPLQLEVVIGFRLDLGFDFLDIVGTVKWMKKESDEIYQAGVEFENIDDVDKKKVIRYLNEQLLRQAWAKKKGTLEN